MMPLSSGPKTYQVAHFKFVFENCKTSMVNTRILVWYVSEVKLEACLLLLNGKGQLENHFFHEKLSLRKVLWAT